MRPTLPAFAVFCAALLVAPTVSGEEKPAAAASEEEALQPLEEELPQVTVVKRGEDTVTEFRLRGKLYLIKVTPLNGPEYYLVDREGRGQWIRDDNAMHLAVPTWVLTSW
ncbi:MAG: DUF2782 domain-containing protein [Azoarcus sp.]|jgi:hypothetical protein|nr:DUF2782 domain-containing protein [Azoarcus sp.]